MVARRDSEFGLLRDLENRRRFWGDLWRDAGGQPPDPRDLSHQASGPGRQPGGGLPVTLTVWPTFGAPVASQQSRILRKAGQILAQTAPATGIFQDRQRKVLNYPVVLRMGSGQ